jgi:hypothetical protein
MLADDRGQCRKKMSLSAAEIACLAPRLFSGDDPAARGGREAVERQDAGAADILRTDGIEKPGLERGDRQFRPAILRQQPAEAV